MVSTYLRRGKHGQNVSYLANVRDVLMNQTYHRWSLFLVGAVSCVVLLMSILVLLLLLLLLLFVVHRSCNLFFSSQLISAFLCFPLLILFLILVFLHRLVMRMPIEKKLGSGYEQFLRYAYFLPSEAHSFFSLTFLL